MKKILIAYYGMIVGGSTTSLLALLNSMDPEEYNIDLQLFSHSGAFLNQIPEYIHLLPPALKYTGLIGKIIKSVKGVLTGELIKALLVNLRMGKKGFSDQILADFYANHASRKNLKEYDIAIGFLEGWPVRYVANHVRAKKKFGWLHSTFANIAPMPELERSWMKNVDHIVFVADNCRDDFKATMPEFAHKAITIHNIVDSKLLRERAEHMDETDEDFVRFRDSNCFKLVTVCRVLISVKGLDRTVGHAKKLKAMGKKFIWAIVGDGEDMLELKKMIQDADIADCVILVGKRMNPLPFVKVADVFCMLSRYEGKPIVVTESMILGTPPIVTRYLSAGEQICNGIDGIIVDNGDDTALEVLLKCMEEPYLVQEMREYLRKNEYGNASYIRSIAQKYFN